MRISKSIIIITLCLLVGGVYFISEGNTDNNMHYNLAKKGNVEITLTAPELKINAKNLETNKTLVLDGFSASALPNEEIIFVGNDFSLRKASFDGQEEIILGPQEASAQVFINEAGTMAVYTKPRDFEGGDIPFTNGIAVYDFTTNTEKILLIEEGKTLLHFGWFEDKILMKYPGKEYFELLLLDLDGNLTKFKTQDVLPLSRKMALRSFDGKFLAYESIEDEVVVLDLTTGSAEKIKNSKEPQWSKDGLKLLKDNSYETYRLK